jgi:hypothetical protein
MNRGSTRSAAGRWAVPLILAASLVAAAAYHASAASRFAVLEHGSLSRPLGTLPKTPARVPPIPLEAVAANPFDQRAVNNVIATRAYASADRERALKETALLGQLGWRSTPALQNLAWRASLIGDVDLLIDSLDAMLRRERLLSVLYPALDQIILQPEGRELLLRRLVGNPPWRLYYLLSASDLQDPDVIEARYLIMRDIQQAGQSLTRNEIAPVLPKLIATGRTEQAFELWQGHVGDVARPLADPQFEYAAQPSPIDALPVPFEWQFGNGAGFFSDASIDDSGSFASIDWNGRGVPVFMSQLTTATPGRYRLSVAGEAPMSQIAIKAGFRLVCPDRSKVEFFPVNAGSGARMELAGHGRVTCNSPTFEIFGLIQPATTTTPIVLRSISLQRTEQ